MTPPSETPPGANEPRPDPAPDSAVVDFKRGTPSRAVVVLVLVGITVAAIAGGAFLFHKPARMERQPASVGPGYRPKGEEGTMGCPCGCDRSSEMVAQLRELPAVEAVSAVDATLATIADREAAGYVTEAQIEHRLNLLSLREERSPGTWVAPRLAWAPGGGGRPIAANGALAMWTELIVHGETTEIVHGRAKLQLAHFVLRLFVRNEGRDAVVLGVPRLHADVGLPVRRWYVVGTAGRPWDGRLAPGEQRRVHAIGYLSEAVPPGAVIDATIEVGSLVTRSTVRAREHWNDEG